MRTRSSLLAAAAGLALTAAASAQFASGVQAGPLNSNGAAGAAVNGVYTFNYAGPAFIPGNFVLSGTLNSGGVGSWSSEARWRITAPSGETFNTSSALPGTANSTWTTPITITSAAVNVGGAFAGSTVNGNWTFRGFESFNDGGDTAVDANWTNFSWNLNAFVPLAPPTSTNLGTLAAGGMVMGQNPYVSNTVQWYRVTLPAAIPAGELFSVSTFGNTLAGGQFGNEDTQIAVFNSLGNLIGSNDDFGGSLASYYSTTAGVAAGDYYIAASAFSLASGSGFSATANDSVPAGGVITGDIKITIIPAPGAAALLGLGGLLAARRRRN